MKEAELSLPLLRWSVCLSISQEAEDSFHKLQSFTILSASVIPLSSLSIPCGAQWEKPEYRTVLYYAEVYFYVQYGTHYFKLMGFFYYVHVDVYYCVIFFILSTYMCGWFLVHVPWCVYNKRCMCAGHTLSETEGV